MGMAARGSAISRFVESRWGVTAIVLGALFVTVLIGTLVWSTERSHYDAQAKRDREHQAAAAAANSGTDVKINGNLMRWDLVVPGEIHRGDSLAVVLHLKSASGSDTGVADETAGTLTAHLTVGGCTVTDPTSPLSRPTKGTSANGFVWSWSTDTCASAGWKAVQVLVTYEGGGKSSDAVAFRRLAFVQVTDPVSAQDIVTFVVTGTGLLSGAATLIGAFRAKRGDKEQ